MDNTIRRLCIGSDPKNQFVYFIGGEHKLFIEGKQRVVTVTEIAEIPKYFLIYVNTGNEVQLWKKLPKNDQITVEFLLD